MSDKMTGSLAILLRPKTAAVDRRCLACRNTDGPLPIRPVDRCCLPTGPVPRLARLRRTSLGGIVGCVFPAVLDEDSARPRLPARVRRLPARYLQAKGLVRRPPKLTACGKLCRRGRGHGLGRLGTGVDLALHQA